MYMNKDECYHNVLDILPKNDKRVEERCFVHDFELGE